MFYENDRIVRKQRRYVNSKACDMIDDFEKKDLESDEIIAALELLSENKENSEFDVDVINRALIILKGRKKHE